MKPNGTECPKCGKPMTVMDTVWNDHYQERYRRRRCNACGHVAFSVEFEIEDNDRFRRDWNKCHRVWDKKGK